MKMQQGSTRGEAYQECAELTFAACCPCHAACGPPSAAFTHEYGIPYAAADKQVDFSLKRSILNLFHGL